VKFYQILAKKNLYSTGIPHYTVNHRRHFVNPVPQALPTGVQFMFIRKTWRGFGHQSRRSLNRGIRNLQGHLNEIAWLIENADDLDDSMSFLIQTFNF